MADSGWPAWPPPPAPSREISSSLVQFDGIDCTISGGNCFEEGTELAMNGRGHLAYAIYSVDQIGQYNEIVSVESSFSEDPVYPGDGTELVFGVANYGLGCWEWIEQPAAGAVWNPGIENAENYRDSEGNAHLAVVLAGPGEARIHSVSFTLQGGLPVMTKPRNLVAVCDEPGLVELTWESVDGADGYNLFCSLDSGFASKVKVNSGLISGTSFSDSHTTDGDYYFYYATAVGLSESGPSDTARVWCMGVDLPAPLNVELESQDENCVTITWDWDDPGGDPECFALFWDTQPEFTLQSDTMQMTSVFGGARSNTFHDVEPGILYYWKMCAAETAWGPYGRMCDELIGTSKSYWTFAEAETLSYGNAPVRAVMGEEGIAIAYFGSWAVNLAMEIGDSWLIETPLPPSCDLFAQQLDLSYGGGVYLVAALAPLAGDCWVSTRLSDGEPGAWDPVLVHGDGIREHDSPKSGYYPATGASSTELCVVQYFLTDFDLLLHTRQIGGETWSTQTIRLNFEPGATPVTSVQYRNGNLYVLSSDDYSNSLVFGDRAGGWIWRSASAPTAPDLGIYHDLQWFNSEWQSPVLCDRAKEMYLIHGTSPPWRHDLLECADEEPGHYSRMAVEGDEAIIIEYSDAHYNYGFYSKDWKSGPIIVPGVTEYEPGADIVLKDGIPYLAFCDRLTGEIKVAKGKPPLSY